VRFTVPFVLCQEKSVELSSNQRTWSTSPPKFELHVDAYRLYFNLSDGIMNKCTYMGETSCVCVCVCVCVWFVWLFSFFVTCRLAFNSVL